MESSTPIVKLSKYQKQIKCKLCYQRFFKVNADGCRQDGSPVAVCTIVVLKKPLTEDTPSDEEDAQGSL